MKRCCPTVIPAFPPTGATGVGSLRPLSGGSAFTMVIEAAACEGRDAPRIRAATAQITARRIVLRLFSIGVHRAAVRQEFRRGVDGIGADERVRSIRIHLHHSRMLKPALKVYPQCAICTRRGQALRGTAKRLA